jgi:eukaryotic-like serine/threonine-protein kinase
VYTQLTDFTDSAVAPALSPDGRMLAFLRSDKWFMTPDQIYGKMLPGGEATLLVDDRRQKYGLTFSPDGSQIAYTVNPGSGYSTYVVPALKGEPRLLMANAAGLTWLDANHLLFAEIKSGMHLGVVTATRSRSEHREVYFPQHERSMAHYAAASPDRRWALVVEMDHRPVWQPCRLVPLSGDSRGRQVGPRGYCTAAGWSPDGQWMYFTAAVEEQHHLWRQRFPDGAPEQLTFGPEQEDGVAVAPDGSIVTSIGTDRRALWIHDRAGERPLSSEGTVVTHIGVGTLPTFSRDAKWLYYVRRESPVASAALWRTDVDSGKTDPLLPGTAIGDYDVSPDGTEVVFSTQPEGKPTEVWLAPIDGTAPPRRLAAHDANAPRFGPDGEILFRYTEHNVNYVGRINRDGSSRSKVADFPIGTFQSASPDRRWLIAITPSFERQQSGVSMAVGTRRGDRRAVCSFVCPSAWSPDGEYLYLTMEHRSRTSAGQAVALPVRPETGLPDLPEGGIRSMADALAIAGSQRLAQDEIVPGLDPSTYAFIKTTTHRNLFRVRLP